LLTVEQFRSDSSGSSRKEIILSCELVWSF
jgi:hypothetical protein